jgi:hypothetical protein
MRLPTAFLVGGLSLKAALVFAWRLFQLPILYALLVTYDPIATQSAEFIAVLFTDPKSIAPTRTTIILYEVLLVAVFGLECWALGRVVQVTRRTRASL